MNMSENTEIINKEEELLSNELSSLDRLFKEIKQYCSGPEFLKKLEFYSNFPYIGAYNAALVEEQRPGARFVLTARKWKKMHDRKIKLDARPVIILLPFYPVEFLFDISDTEPINENPHRSDDQIIEDIIQDHKASCTHELYFYFRNLDFNLPKQGISYHKNFIVGSEIRAKATTDQSEKLHIRVFKESCIIHHNHFTISVDTKADAAEELALMFHELAHIFCHHINYPWWKQRSCSQDIKEFEAEIVSFLVCNRLGINYSPVKYLSSYVNEDSEIPDISLDAVLRAVDQIELLAKESLEINKCLLYKNDDTFKVKIDIERERIRKEKERQKAIRQSI